MSNFIQQIFNALSQIEWSTVMTGASALLSLVGGAAAVPYISRIKNFYKLGPRMTQLLTVFIATLVAIATMIVNNVIVPDIVTVDYVVKLFILVLLASQAEYWRIVKASMTEQLPANIEPASE